MPPRKGSATSGPAVPPIFQQPVPPEPEPVEDEDIEQEPDVPYDPPQDDGDEDFEQGDAAPPPTPPVQRQQRPAVPASNSRIVQTGSERLQGWDKVLHLVEQTKQGKGGLQYTIKRTGPQTWGRRMVSIGLLEPIEEPLLPHEVDEEIRRVHMGGTYKIKLHDSGGKFMDSWTLQVSGPPARGDLINENIYDGTNDDEPEAGRQRDPGASRTDRLLEALLKSNELMIEEMRDSRTPPTSGLDQLTAILDKLGPLLIKSAPAEDAAEKTARLLAEREDKIRGEMSLLIKEQAAKIDGLIAKINDPNTSNSTIDKLGQEIQNLREQNANEFSKLRTEANDAKMEVLRVQMNEQQKRHDDQLKNLTEKLTEKGTPAEDPLDRLQQKLVKRMEFFTTLQGFKNILTPGAAASGDDDDAEDGDFSFGKALGRLLNGVSKKFEGRLLDDGMDGILGDINKLGEVVGVVEDERPQPKPLPQYRPKPKPAPQQQIPAPRPAPQQAPAPVPEPPDDTQIIIPGFEHLQAEIDEILSAGAVALFSLENKGKVPVERAADVARRKLSPKAMALCRQFPDPLSYLYLAEHKLPQKVRMLLVPEENKDWFRQFYALVIADAAPEQPVGQPVGQPVEQPEQAPVPQDVPPASATTSENVSAPGGEAGAATPPPPPDVAPTTPTTRDAGEVHVVDGMRVV